MISLAKQLIKQHEGLRLKPYHCTAGKLTIGYGRNLDDLGITEEEADALLETDLRRVLQQVGSLDFWHHLDDVRQAVLIDMCFNLGWGRLNHFSKMLHACRIADYQGAALEMLDSRWAGQVGQRALTLSEMMRTGEAP